MCTIQAVNEVLNNHKTDYCTLNRLWFKHVKSLNRYPEDYVCDVPVLTRKNVKITTETKNTAELFGLIGPGNRNKPFRDDTPVVIVRFRDRDCVIDGASRCRMWNEANNQNMHEAYILIVQE